MNMLTRKDIKQQQEQEQQQVFNKLKGIFTTKPALAVPNLDKEFRLEINISNYTTRVLSMKCSDELWRLVAFISESLSDIERNYQIHNKEMLAVIRCSKVQRHFLERVTIKFKIQTDHENLKYFMKAQKLNYRQARWALYLSKFDFTLKHILGNKMEKTGLGNRHRKRQ